MDSPSITCTELADYKWLTGSEAATIASELRDANRPLPTLVANLRKCLSASRTRLLLELIDLRHRGATKFSAADCMFFTRISLEQATDEWIARYKASRFSKLQVGSSQMLSFADLCCGIGGDLLALAEQGSVTGVDLNPCLIHFAAENARAALPSNFQPRVSLRAIDVEQFDIGNIAAWHIDPDRRPRQKSRTSSPEWSSPALPVLDRMLAQKPNAAIKLAPAADVPPQWADRCEVEWISRDRQCRQLVAWHGDLVQAPGKHRATIVTRRVNPQVDDSASTASLVTRTITGAPAQQIPLTPQLDHYVFDVDPAVVAARLNGALAAEHELLALAPGPTYLTGPSPIEDLALACFEVTDVMPYQPKLLARYFRQRGIGRLEIKKRGNDIDVDPHKLRRILKLRGDNPATLLVSRLAGRHVAIVAQRVAQSS